MAFDPLHVANEIIALRRELLGRGTTNVDLNKEAYIGHGLHLALYDEPLLDESVKAWQYGPVVPSIYRAAKRFGSGEVDGALGDGSRLPNSALGRRAARVLRVAIEKYRHYDSSALIMLTHRRNSPWYQVTNGGEDIGYNRTIPDGVIAAYYRRMLGRD